MKELTDDELKEFIDKFRDEEGRRDWDFVNEALMAQLILEVRRVGASLNKSTWFGPK